MFLVDLHVPALEEPQQRHRYKRYASVRPMAFGVSNCALLRDDVFTVLPGYPHRMNLCVQKHTIGLTGGKEIALLNYQLYF